MSQARHNPAQRSSLSSYFCHSIKQFPKRAIIAALLYGLRQQSHWLVLGFERPYQSSLYHRPRAIARHWQYNHPNPSSFKTLHFPVLQIY